MTIVSSMSQPLSDPKKGSLFYVLYGLITYNTFEEKMMYTNHFTPQIPFSLFVNDAMKSKVKDIQNEQIDIYNRIAYDKSGKTRSSLNSLATDTTMMSDKFTIKYPMSVQFLDMRTGAKGREKTFHEFIYLRVVYGHLYGGNKRRKKKVKSFRTIILAEIHRRWEDKIKNEINNIINNG